MKRISDLLLFFAVLLFLFIIYGVVGAYEADSISLLQLLKYVFLFGMSEAVTIAGAKVTAAVTTNNSRRIKKASNMEKEAS